MADWVLAAERAYVAAAVGGQTAATTVGDADATSEAVAERRAHAIAAAGAVASRFLAVGTPRSFGIVIDDAGGVAAAALTLVAHRTWFQPRDIRCASLAGGAGELAAATAGRVVSVDEALACDIVNVHALGARIAPRQLRRGSHVNAVTREVLDPELARLATLVDDAGLPALAAGLVDGRQLDELTIFVIGPSPIAGRAVAEAAETAVREH